MNFLTGLGLKVWGYVAAAVAVVAALWTALAKAKQAGRTEVSSAVNQASGAAAARMAEAAVKAPKERDDVVKDLRAGKF